VDLRQPAKAIHNFIRGLDSSPGAWAMLGGQQTKLFGSRLWHGAVEPGREVELEGAARPGVVTKDGLMLAGTDGRWLCVKLLSVAGKFVKAHEFGEEKEEEPELELSADEADWVEKVRAVWAAILKTSVENDTDFFGAGAGSMDVVRLIEEVVILYCRPGNPGPPGEGGVWGGARQ
jgi:formyltetrahydrofolate dehydrogenase